MVLSALHVKDWLDAVLAGQKENFLLWVPVFLGLGAAAYFSLDYEPSFAMTGGIMAAAMTAILVMRGRLVRGPDKTWRHVFYLLSIVMFLFTLGIGAAKLQTWRSYTPMTSSDTRPLMVEGRLIHQELQEGKRGLLIVMDDIDVEDWPPEKTPRKVRLTVRKKMDASLGDRVKFLAKLTPPSPPVMPGGYDFQRHYYFEGIGALGFALSDATVTAKAESGGLFLEELRQKIGAKIRATVPEREAGIVSALMTGERAAIYEEDWQALRVSGLAHIISISGLHVAMVAAPVFFLVRLFLACIPYITLRYPIKKYAAGVALLVACLYVGLVVPSVPTTRALLMTAMALIAIMLDRSPFSLRLVAVAAILVLLFQPDSIWNVSFQMSFAAVAALVAVAEALTPFWGRIYREAGFIKRGALWVAGALLTSFIASIATAPFSLYHFQQIASYSVFANFASIPLSGLIIMPMLMISFILMPFGAADWSLHLMGQGVDWLLDVARYTESLPGAQIKAAAMPFVSLVWISLAGIILALSKGKVKWVVVVPVMVAIVLWGLDRRPDILLSDSGEAMAVLDDDKFYLLPNAREKFVTETWQRNYGISDDHVLRLKREGVMDLSNGQIACDGSACRITVGTHKISYGARLYELQQECDWADIILTPVRVPRDFCGNGVRIVDYYILKRSGAVAWSFEGSKVTMDTVHVMRGSRPWTGNQ